MSCDRLSLEDDLNLRRVDEIRGVRGCFCPDALDVSEFSVDFYWFTCYVRLYRMVLLWENSSVSEGAFYVLYDFGVLEKFKTGISFGLNLYLSSSFLDSALLKTLKLVLLAGYFPLGLGNSFAELLW